ncbi:Rieske 2Fe-2S domain-containing protein [Acaryochloris sp. IP29b_bin.148]|uniref:Rieske 2Fe-2S domain-containing protein n=1 Tax=Acaryochloris sp. IP29b_bin.148 TaxID=2969218 RepID=UPI0034516EAD
MRSMLPGAPWLLAHKSMLPINHPLKVSLYGTDYVLWQDGSGTIQALPNRCPHMGAMLSEGWCEPLPDKADEQSGIVCPFHALRFDGAGCTVLPDSDQKTLPQLQPLELIIQGNFIWSYGGHKPKMPIPNIMNEIAQTYDFIGPAADYSVKTDLLSMLLVMHDYNHQNGTHRDLFRITSVDFHQFVDNGHQSHALYDMVTDSYSWREKLRKPDLLMMPDLIKAHIENHFPCLGILRAETPLGKIAQCHFFLPEAENLTRTYILLFAQLHYPFLKPLSRTFLKFGQVAVEQDVDILGKLYTNSPKQIKLNNEVGMDWVRRNFEHFPEVVTPNLSK